MKTTGASGTHTHNERWPKPPLVPPRGLRELLWYLAAVLAIVLVVAAPLLRIFVAISLLMLWGLSQLIGRFPYPREMAGHALTLQLMAASHLTGLDGPSGWHRTVVALLLDRYPAPEYPGEVAGLLLLLAVIGTLSSMAVAILAFLVSFDRRRVARDVVDERVWQRQQTLRRSLMLEQHRRDGAPEVW